MAAPQDLNSGHLRLIIVPGRISAIRGADDANPRLQWRTAFPMQPGAVLNLRDLEQGLENLRRPPTVTADFEIEPSQGKDAGPGESDVIINWQQRFPARFTLAVDNSGAEATGKYQGSVTVSADHWLGLNDLFYISLNHDLDGGGSGDSGTKGGTVHYSVPIGYSLISVTRSEYQYFQTIEGVNEPYTYSGESNNSDIRLSRVWFRDSRRKLSMFIGGWSRSSRNYIDDTEIQIQKRRMAGWKLGVDHRQFWGDKLLELNLEYTRGTGARGALPAPEEPIEQGVSRPEIVDAAIGFNWPFYIGNQFWRFSSEWRGQWNRTPLMPQDRFSLGGRFTVRGFDGERVLAAERGWLIRNDLGWQPWPRFELYWGLDYGKLSGAEVDQLAGDHLSGTVLGVRGRYFGLSYDLFAGAPVSKPDNFETDSTVTAFSVSASF